MTIAAKKSIESTTVEQGTEVYVSMGAKISPDLLRILTRAGTWVVIESIVALICAIAIVIDYPESSANIFNLAFLIIILLIFGLGFLRKTKGIKYSLANIVLINFFAIFLLVMTGLALTCGSPIWAYLGSLLNYLVHLVI